MRNAISLAFIAITAHLVYCFRIQLHLDSFDIKLVEGESVKENELLSPRSRKDSKMKVLDGSMLEVNTNKELTTTQIIVTKKSKESSEMEPNIAPAILQEKEKKSDKDWTANFGEQCLYQYPDKQQVDAVLGNMMNELSNVFLKANELLKEEVSKGSSNLENSELIQRTLATTFSIAHDKRRVFFDDIHNHMSNEFRRFYNSSTARVSNSEHEICRNQERLKEIWRALLENSVETLKDAMRQSMEEYLKEHKVDPESKLGGIVNEYLRKEMNRISSEHHKLLCDKFNICHYDELLKDT